ncbi:MAG: tetratricopeptide repeat protein, partial [Candidatus Omnitrophica bacterium]|nr:tetratricopeptide repeat protein [Candidatus Omnitrophota bacterium]
QKADGFFSALQFEKAKGAYEELIRQYPQYRGLGRVKLRLAECLQRLDQYNEAQKICKGVIWSDYGAVETEMAKRLIFDFKSQAKLRQERKSLKKQLLSASPNMAGMIYFKLGEIEMNLSEYESAVENFKNCLKANPPKETAARAEFDMAWCLRQMREYGQGVEVLNNLAQANQGKDMAVGAMAQMANILYSRGQIKEAADLYLKLADDNPQSSLGSLLLYSSGSIYYFDLNDTKKATEIFTRLKNSYPVSMYSYSPFGLKLVVSEGRAFRLSPTREALLKKYYNPIAGWIENSFPVVTRIVNTTINRMAQKLLGEKEEATFTRDYTEEEFYKFALEPFLSKRKGQIPSAGMKIKNKKIYGQADVNFGILKVNISGSSLLSCADNQFIFDLDSLKVGFVPMPKAVLSAISYSVNKALSEDNFPLQVKKVDVKEGAIAITYRVIKSDEDFAESPESQ